MRQIPGATAFATQQKDSWGCPKLLCLGSWRHSKQRPLLRDSAPLQTRPGASAGLRRVPSQTAHHLHRHPRLLPLRNLRPLPPLPIHLRQTPSHRRLPPPDLQEFYLQVGSLAGCLELSWHRRQTWTWKRTNHSPWRLPPQQICRGHLVPLPFWKFLRHPWIHRHASAQPDPCFDEVGVFPLQHPAGELLEASGLVATCPAWPVLPA
mmetsp:Transcript_62469/g.136714  ORF Transcript_62469/g.136714 Transcript_62469/m.136714 type:complete len:207 (+) Transcript_62469:2255-2875(+)